MLVLAQARPRPPRDSLPRTTAEASCGFTLMVTSAAPGRSARHNVPASLTSFLGREREVAEVRARLAAGRLLTLTGVGGCGKTRLALEVARVVLDQYPDGVWLVELGPTADAALVPHSVAAVVGARETAGQSTVNALASRLRARRLLLVLDNCEHLLDACAQLVDVLLRACPEVRVLATSREALGITGEVAWRVPSLPVPDPHHLPQLAELRANPAVRLFTERASATQSQFVLTERNAPAVAQVCARLDGIPLALELAAARVAGLAVDQLAARLGQRFRLLTGGSRTALPRQQTLRATLDWSYDLLSQPEQMLLERLSVFAGGWTLEAAEVVCSGAGIEVSDVTDGLLRLVNKSLVVADEAPDGRQRYRLLETVRQYARERLGSAAEAEAAHERHAAYFLAYVEAHDPEELLRAKGLLNPERSMLDQLEGELDNLRAALRWWIESPDAERALHQAAALFRIWYLRGSLTRVEPGSRRCWRCRWCGIRPPSGCEPCPCWPTSRVATASTMSRWRLSRSCSPHAGRLETRAARRRRSATWRTCTTCVPSTRPVGPASKRLGPRLAIGGIQASSPIGASWVVSWRSTRAAMSSRGSCWRRSSKRRGKRVARCTAATCS